MSNDVENKQTKQRHHQSLLPWILIVTSIITQPIHASIQCESNEFCQDFLHPASQCGVDKTCSSPFYQGGCLHNFKSDWKKIRVCNSEDPPEAMEEGYCRQPNQDVMEIRIASQNWESVFFSAWILQILLSEILGIPATVETGTPDANVNFYDSQMRFEYGVSSDWEAIRRSTRLRGDCSLADRSPDSYETCAHLIPEVWNPRLKDILQLAAEGYAEQPDQLGALGQQHLLIPMYTGVENPSLLTYLGLSGPQNRKKLAEIFLWPTTWADYCNEVSLDNCESADNTTTRSPIDEAEGGKYFVEGLYSGYFRETDAGNCTLHPDTCVGHLLDYPCDWASFVAAQVYHLDIGLESVPYPYSSMIEIWSAANHTKSNIIGHWWTPEILYQQYLGTDFELVRVSLPAPTQECIENRIKPQDRCAKQDDLFAVVGDPLGACDDPPHSLRKVLSKSIYELSNDPDIPEGIRSPAYDAIKSYSISELQIGQIFQYWTKVNKDYWNYDPREAVCEWVVQNFDWMQAFVPVSHPRVFLEINESSWEPLQITALVCSLIASIFVAIAAIGTFLGRNRRAIGSAQLEFLALLLVGLVLVAFASIMLAFPPTDITCMTTIWLFNIGYTLELVPLVVKMAAINRLMVAAQQMRRVVLKQKYLFGVVFGLSFLIVIYLTIWTVFDPSVKSIEYILTDEKTTIDGNTGEGGETIVWTSPFCESNKKIWREVSFAWHGLLLLWATILAFQTRNLREDVNETSTLAMLIYSHFFFLVLRVVIFLLEGNIRQLTARLSRSLLLSFDIIGTVCIYFLPKLLFDENATRRGSVRRRSTVYSDPFQNMPQTPTLSEVIDEVSIRVNGGRVDAAGRISSIDSTVLHPPNESEHAGPKSILKHPDCVEEGEK